MGTGPSVRLRRVIALPPLRPAVAGYRAPLPRAGVPDRTAGRGQRILLSRPATGAAIRRERSALPVASSTLAWTEKTSIRRVRVRSRSTCCCGAASSRSPPACRACFRARTSAATPLQSMKSRPARSTIISRSRAAAAVSAAATLAASTGQAAAQRDDDLTVAFAGTHIHADDGGALPTSAARRGLDPAASSPASRRTLRRIPARVLSWAMRCQSALAVRTVSWPPLPATTGCGNPAARVTGACALAA